MRVAAAIAIAAAMLALVSSPLAYGETVEITAKGYYELWQKSGVKISQHTSEREAVQRALNSGPGMYEIRQPIVEVTVAKAFNTAYPDCGTGRCSVTPAQIAEHNGKTMPRIIANTEAWIAAGTGAPRWPFTLCGSELAGEC